MRKLVLAAATAIALTIGGAAAAQEEAAFPTGVVVEQVGTRTPDGWLAFDSGTIGSGKSVATHAGAHLWTLYDLLWRETRLPVSGGGRGASAAEDFAAGKVITLPLEPRLMMKI
jgi:hypothetical protein